MEEVEELRRLVAVSCRILGYQGVTQAAFGHVSARVPGTDTILIKSRGSRESSLQFTTTRDIVTLDMAGRVIEGESGLDAPHETAMHLAVYRTRPEVMSVIHTHPVWAVVLTACDKPLVPMFAAYNPPAMRMLTRGIPVHPRSVTIVNDELGREFLETLGDKEACLLRGHGMTTVGTNVPHATMNSLRVFEICRVNYLAYSIGTPTAVLDEDLDWYAARFRESGDLPSRGDRSGWLHQIRLLEMAGLADVNPPAGTDA